MIPKEVLRQIKRIEIVTSRLADDIFAGQYSSIFKGRGMEFSEVREYQPGDEIRTIDWNVTARYGKPFVKKFAEERELTIMLLVDMSGSGNFGTSTRFKSELAAEIAAVLSFSALRNNDKVGLIIFTNEVEKYLPPKKSRRHILRLIREILFFQPQGLSTNIATALQYLNEVQRRRAIGFVLSDFWDSGYEKALRITNRRHDMVAISLTDPRELNLPAIGRIELCDRETGERVVVNTNSVSVREQFAREVESRIQRRDEIFLSAKVDHINILTDQSYVKPLINFFQLRNRFRNR